MKKQFGITFSQDIIKQYYIEIEAGNKEEAEGILRKKMQEGSIEYSSHFTQEIVDSFSAMEIDNVEEVENH